MRVISLVLGASLLLVASVGFAKATHSVKKPTVVQNELILVHAAPKSNAEIIQKVSPSHRLVPIIRQGEWIKVGDASDGKVGWINRNQYKKAMKAFYRPNIQTVFIRAERDVNGKPTINIIAYKNGKKLSKKEADVIYKRIRKERIRESRYMNRMFWSMHRTMDQEMHDMDQFMAPWDNMGFGPEIIQPVIVVNPQQKSALENHSKKH